MKRALVLTVALATTLVACGDTPTPPDQARTRNVEVSMTDMAFSPAELDVTAGETVRFVFRNDGAVSHEAVFGNVDEQQAHHDDMAPMGAGHDAMDMGSMPHSDDMAELHAVEVEPGETVEMMHTFGTGPTVIGCHEPGHWEAGMRLDVDVT